MANRELWKFVEFLSLLSKYPTIAADSKLILLAAEKIGFKDNKVLHRIAQVQ